MKTSVFRKFSSAIPSLANATLMQPFVEVTFSNNSKTKVPLIHLLDNANELKTVSNQKKHRSISSFLSSSLPTPSLQVQGPTLEIKYSDAIFTVPSTFLSSLVKKNFPNSPACSPLLEKVNYTKVLRSESEAYKLTTALCKHGLCLVNEIPGTTAVEEAKSSTVFPCAEIATRTGNLSHQLYGEVFDVISTEEPINVAYTSERLEFHQDLVYYESPPGLQFLHCNVFPSETQGGESLFLDSLAAANAFRELDAKSFFTLKSLSACFQKVHSQGRSKAVNMVFHRPHIVTRSPEDDDVIAVFWAPPFEGPVDLPVEDMLKYYEAYAKFQEFLNSDEALAAYGIEFRLKEGEMIAFNNRRMLHARRSYQGKRHFQGCYVDIDSFQSTHNVLEATLGKARNQQKYKLGILNHSL
eukprot:maker-scaffold_49-snap-gene-1.98-mRNA-1 protein AED:0.01 eAED:0.01 QI:63/1/1/1/0/0/2/241/410